MFFSQSSGKRKSASVRQSKLHTITGLSQEREFAGSFELGNATYKFAYAPIKGEIRDGKFYLQGKLTITNPRGRSARRDNVKAVLAGIQGGLGGSPPRPSSGELISAFERKRTVSNEDAPPQGQRPLPIVDNTDARSFSGVMYFIFDPVEGRSLGVPADMSRVQLNARFYTIEETSRTLHGIYSSIVDAIDGPLADSAAASGLVQELNKKLS